MTCTGMRLLRGVSISALLCLPGLAQGVWTEEEAGQLRSGEEALRAGRYPEAERIFSELGLQHPESGAVFRLLGHAYVEQGLDLQAREAFVRALSLGELRSDVLSRFIEIDHRAGRELAMRAAVQLELLLDPDRLEWKRLYGDLLLRQGEALAAHAVFASLIASHPNDPELRERRGRAALELGQTEEAAVAFETAYYLGARGSDLARRIERLWFNEADDRRALYWSTRRVGDGEDPAETLRRAGALFRLGELEPAAELAREALVSEGPTRARAHLLLGQIAEERGDLPLAVEQWERSLEEGYADDGRVAEYLGLHFFQEADHEQACRYLELRVSVGEPDRRVLRYLIECFLETGRFDDASASIASYLEEHGLDEAVRGYIRRLASR